MGVKVTPEGDRERGGRGTHLVPLDHVAEAILRHILVDRLSSDRKIIVRNRGKKQMVHDVPMGNMVVEIVQTKAELPVDGLEGAVDEVPVFVVKNFR